MLFGPQSSLLNFGVGPLQNVELDFTANSSMTKVKLLEVFALENTQERENKCVRHDT